MLAGQAAWQLGLERVLLVPTGIAPHKAISPEPGAEVRLRMARAAAEGDELLEVCDYEVARARRGAAGGAAAASGGAPSYTHETLAWLTEQRPGSELWLLLGADAAAGLPGWHFPDEVAAMARLAIAPRAGVSDAQLDESVARVRGEVRRETVEMPELAISSSLIRARVRTGMPLRYLVPDPVAAIIAAERIYGDADDE